MVITAKVLTITTWEHARFILEQVRNKLPKCDASEMVRLIDSSIIDLNLNQFEWADLRSTKAGKNCTQSMTLRQKSLFILP